MDTLLGKLRDISAVLVQKHNDNTGQKEYALVSKKDHDKVLEWYGPKKPSDDAVAQTESRVQYFKHKGGSTSFSPDELAKLGGPHSSWENKGDYWSSSPLGFYWVDIRLSKPGQSFVIELHVHGRKVNQTSTPNFREALSRADGYADDVINQQEIDDDTH